MIGESGSGKSSYVNQFIYNTTKKKDLQQDKELKFHQVNLIQKESKFTPLTKPTLDKANFALQKKRKFLEFKEREKALKFTVKICEVPFLHLFHSKEELYTLLNDYESYDFITEPHGVFLVIDGAKQSSIQVFFFSCLIYNYLFIYLFIIFIVL